MQRNFALALLSTLAVAAPNDAAFINFAAKHNKSYKNKSEMDHRKNNWTKSTWIVEGLNASGDTATYEVNFTGDMDDFEFKKMFGVSENPAPRNLEELLVYEDETHRREL